MAAPSQEEINRQMIKDMFAEFMPLIKEIALTPEKLRDAQKPYEDPAVLAQRLRDRESSERDAKEARAFKKRQQDNCGHVDAKNDTTIRLVHNYPDNMPRGLCTKCDLWIQPAHWDFRPVTQPDGSHKEEGIVIKEHPLYHLVRKLEYTT